MNIFGIFTLASSAKKVFSAENVKSFLTFIRAQIIYYVDKKELLGKDKKANVDARAIEYVKTHWFGYNSVLDWFLEKIFIPVIPIVTQAVYDLLKARVENLTV